jgi:hypothetical protein
VEEDVDACLSVVMLSPELPGRNAGLLFPNGDPTGVSSGEKRSAAQIKFDDSTVLKRQLGTLPRHLMTHETSISSSSHPSSQSG